MRTAKNERRRYILSNMCKCTKCSGVNSIFMSRFMDNHGHMIRKKKSNDTKMSKLNGQISYTMKRMLGLM